MGGGLVCGQCTLCIGEGLMFMGSDRLVGSGCHSGMGGHCFIKLSLLHCLHGCCVALSVM